MSLRFKGAKWGKGKPNGTMWDIPLAEVRELWKPVMEETLTYSVVLSEVLTTLEEDTNYIRATDHEVPSKDGDDNRAEACARWLIRSSTVWIRRLAVQSTRRMTTDELVAYSELIEDDSANLDSIISDLQSVSWLLPAADVVSRTKMVLAQAVGYRAIYRGSQHHPDPSVTTAASHTLPIILHGLPKQLEEGNALLVESTKASLMNLLERLKEDV